jgi:hypothetical protein
VDKIAQQIKVRREPKAQLCRFSRSRQKGICLTEGGLLGYELITKRSQQRSYYLLQRGAIKRHRSHKQGRTERKLVLNSRRNCASDSPVEAEQEELIVEQKAKKIDCTSITSSKLAKGITTSNSQ